MSTGLSETMSDTTEARGPAAQALLHLEIVHCEPDAVFEFLRDCLGAELVEKEISEYLVSLFGGSDDHGKGRMGIHVKVGNIVFQIVRPPRTLPTWHAELAERGPGVHNVTFIVNDLEGVKQRMLGQGATEILDMPVQLQEIGLGTEPTRLLVMDAREQTGLRFEMVEPIDGWIPYPARDQLPE